MRARIPVVLALAALLAVACQDSPTDPVEQPVATAPEFNFMNGPAEAGVVFRHQGDIGWVDMIEITPQEETWIMFFGERLGEVPWRCDGTRYETVSWQEIRSEKELAMSNDYDVVAYRMAEFFPLWIEGADLGEEPFCYAGLRAEQIAGGKAHMRTHMGGPQGDNVVVNGNVTWLGDMYRLHYVLRFEGEFGDTPVKAAKSRIW